MGRYLNGYYNSLCKRSLKTPLRLIAKTFRETLDSKNLFLFVQMEPVVLVLPILYKLLDDQKFKSGNVHFLFIKTIF